MYVFNEKLLEKLPNMTGVTFEGISNRLGYNHGFMRNTLRSLYGISVNALIEICNLYHIPVAYFFCTENEIGRAYVEMPDDYAPSRLRMEFIQLLLSGEKKSPARMSVNMLLTHLKSSDENIGNARIGWCKNADSLKAREVVRLCNELHLDINEIIEDPMGLLQSLYSAADFKTRCTEIRNRYQSKFKPRKVSSMRKSIGARKSLEARVAELEQQNRMLKDEIERLRQGPNIGLAASPDVPYERK